MTEITTIQFALHSAGATALGAIVGLERQWRQRMAGTRTNTLVAAGAAAFVMCGSLVDLGPSAEGHRLLCRLRRRLPPSWSIVE
jgi:putative Mg2+ transporter-C (MgtC) family protein